MIYGFAPHHYDNTPPEKETKYPERCPHQGVHRTIREMIVHKLQFLRAISHSLGEHTESFHVPSDVSDDDNASQQQDPQQDVTTSSSETNASSTDTAAQSPQSTDCCEVRLIASHTGVALVPCGHSRFCESCSADAVAAMDNGCPLCRTPITMVLSLYG